MLTLDACSFTDNAGLCGIPGLRSCGPHLSFGAKIGIALGSCVALLLIVTCLMCWWKRRQNILRAQIIAGNYVHPKLKEIGNIKHITVLDMVQYYYLSPLSLILVHLSISGCPKILVLFENSKEKFFSFHNYSLPRLRLFGCKTFSRKTFYSFSSVWLHNL